VQLLLDSALDPVIDETVGENPGREADALIELKIIGPAVGSGHFLLAAARRLAGRIAQLRSPGSPSAEDYRHALREVARHCLYGVDRNPLAVELCKVAIWIETVEPGKPLGFLDANIRCGDSLLGLFDLEALRQGVPDAAYDPLSGDERETARHFKARNRAERSGQGVLHYAGGSSGLPPPPPLADTARAVMSMQRRPPQYLSFGIEQLLENLESPDDLHEIFRGRPGRSFMKRKRPVLEQERGGAGRVRLNGSIGSDIGWAKLGYRNGFGDGRQSTGEFVKQSASFGRRQRGVQASVRGWSALAGQGTGANVQCAQHFGNHRRRRSVQYPTRFKALRSGKTQRAHQEIPNQSTWLFESRIETADA
jgi:hypothetical protein